MTEIALYGLDIVTGANRGYGIAVAKIVESCVRPADAFRNPLKMMIYGMGHQMVSQRIRENKTGYWI